MQKKSAKTHARLHTKELTSQKYSLYAWIYNNLFQIVFHFSISFFFCDT